MKLGDRGTHVVKVQNALNLKGANPKLVTDGIFGNGTLAAVKAFQTSKVLPVTGIVDNATAVKLGLFPSDIVAPVVTTSVPSTTQSLSTSPFTGDSSNALEKFYTVMGGKTMALVGLGVLAAAAAVTYFSSSKEKAPVRVQDKK